MHQVSSVLNGFWQALSQDKRPLAVLLGAGCPASVQGDDGLPLIPTVEGLTVAVCDEVAQGDCASSLAILEKSLEADLGSKPTIEDMLTRLRTLEQVAGGEAVRGLTREAIIALEATLTSTIASRVSVDLPAGQSPYDHLARWAGGINRTAPLQFFTTNYDLLLEQALERAEVPYFDGFVGRHRPFLDRHSADNDDLPVRWSRVWKLHGSVNWQREGAQVTQGPAGGHGALPMIHPSHLKYEQSRRMPYLLMQDRLKAFLETPSALLVACGSSFSDQHINEMLAHGLRVNPTATVFGLVYGGGSGYEEAFEVARRHPNMVIVAEDEASYGGTRGKWQTQDGTSDVCNMGDFQAFGERLRGLLRDQGQMVASTDDGSA